MENICKKDLCTGCTACAAKCPKKAIIMTENDEGFLYPQISKDRCIDCGLCVKICPANRKGEIGRENELEPEFWAGYHLNREILMQSSSGGAFSAIAEIVLSENGVVFGAVIDPKSNKVHHVMVASIEALHDMRLSKYYQSEIEDTYVKVKKQLEAGTRVLFTGTACQVAGLLAYLGDFPKENLITLDVLCHGVASRKVVDAYLRSQEKKNRDKVSSFCFRVKEGPRGWQGGEGHRMKVAFEGGKEFIAERPYDTYFLGFNNSFFLRESCYNCQYCGLNRVSDFTAADYWGCQDDGFSSEQMWAGISLLLINSAKAKELLPCINERMRLVPANKENAVSHNRALSSAQVRPEIRDHFFSLLERYGYDRTIERIFKKRFMKFKIKNIIKKVLPVCITKKVLKNL